MLRKTINSVLVSAFAVSALSACGAPELPAIDQAIAPTAQQVEASSFRGVRSEIEKAMKEQFKAYDADKNKMITPAEYKVATPEEQVQFYKLDDNKDGKITLKEMVPSFFESAKMTLSIKRTAGHLFNQLDKSNDGYLAQEELSSPLISAQYAELFKKFDKEKPFLFFNKGTKSKLSKSEFENMFAKIAFSSAVAAPAPAPAEPPADAPPASEPDADRKSVV